MTTSQNLMGAYDPMSGKLAGTAMQCQARGFGPESGNDVDALAILSWAVTTEIANG